ncbi:MAG: PAS domain-containing protein [Chloroflexi bacterium]|nr:PAS domain-containing protein [Chloroflexota bacterium]
MQPTGDGFVGALQALAHSTRLRAVMLLAEREYTAGELADALELRPNLVAHHLGMLHQAGFVTCRPDETDRRVKWYALDRRGFAELSRTLARFDGNGADRSAGEPSAGGQELLLAMARTGDGFFVVDAEYRILLWNAGAETLLGFRARDVVGRSCHEVLAGHDPVGKSVCQIPCRPMQLAAAGLPPTCFSLAVGSRTGGERPIGVSLVPLPGGLVGHVFHDAGRLGDLERVVAQIRQVVTGVVGVSQATPAPRVETPADLPRLTQREREVLGLLADGADTAAIATRLVVGRSTARKHVQSLLAKLGAHSRLEAVAVATRAGLLQ